MSGDAARILVVDDVEDWRLTLRGMLEDEDFAVEVAGSIPEANEKLAQHDFALAILDMRLDEANEDNREGLTNLAVAIKAKHPQTKTIIFTGYGDSDSLETAMEPGPDGTPLVALHLDKTETDKLIDHIKQLLTSET